MAQALHNLKRQSDLDASVYMYLSQSRGSHHRGDEGDLLPVVRRGCVPSVEVSIHSLRIKSRAHIVTIIQANLTILWWTKDTCTCRSLWTKVKGSKKEGQISYGRHKDKYLPCWCHPNFPYVRTHDKEQLTFPGFDWLRQHGSPEQQTWLKKDPRPTDKG